MHHLLPYLLTIIATILILATIHELWHYFHGPDRR